MIASQPCIKPLQILAKKRSIIFRNHHTNGHVHQLLDKTSLTNAISINRFMSNSLRKNLPLQALEAFTKHLRLGFIGNVNEITVALALKACCGKLLPGTQIHGFAITSAFASCVTVCNSLMNMYRKSGQFSLALRIFERLISPDIVSCNTVLSGFLSSDDVIRFAQIMNASGVIFDSVTYTTVLALCSTHEEFLFGLQLHSCVVKCGLDREAFVGNALITMYSRCGHLMEGRRVFEEMLEKDSVSWNAIISGYTQEGTCGLEALRIFNEMVKVGGIEIDHVSLTGSVSACGQEKNLDLARQIHGLSIKRGYGKHLSLGNVLMSTYMKCEVLGEAKLVFQNMDHRNVVSWTTVMSFDEEEAVSVFNEMRSDGVYPNDVTFISLIHAITTGNLVGEGKMVHGFCVKTGFSLELNVCNGLITMYAKFKSMQDSLKVFEELNHKEITTWNALISGYAQNGFCLQAIRTFFSAVMESKPNQYTFGSILSAIGAAEDVSIKQGQRCHSQMLKLGLNADPIVSGALLDMYAKRGSICESQRVFIEMPERSQVAWTAIISAHARHGDYQSVIYWFEEMEKEGVRPDSITFLSVLTACGRKGMVDMGRRLFDSMVKDYQIEPFPQHYSCMVDMLGRAGRLEEAEELLRHIPGGPGLSVLQSLLGACRMHGNVGMGERMADALLKLEPTQSGSYVLMSNLYAEKRQWEKVAEVRKGMREKGVKKEVGFSWVDVGDIDNSLFLHGFSSGDKSHPQWEGIHRMAKFLGTEMKISRRDKEVRERTLQII